MNKVALFFMALVLCVASITITFFVLQDRGTFDEVVVEEPVEEEPIEEEEETEAPPPRQWSGYMQEWLQTNRLVVDYLNVKEKEWCAVAIQRIDPEHPGADPVLECIQ